MITAEKQEVLRWFAEGRKAYQKKDFLQARDCFAAALRLDKNDGPSKVYYYRCKHYLENPPPDDWDGVFVMKTK
jgi:hypothetical protein